MLSQKLGKRYFYLFDDSTRAFSWWYINEQFKALDVLGLTLN